MRDQNLLIIYLTSNQINWVFRAGWGTLVGPAMCKYPTLARSMHLNCNLLLIQYQMENQGRKECRIIEKHQKKQAESSE